MIEEESRELAKTDIGRRIYDTIMDEKNFSQLCGFYYPKDITAVHGAMIKGLEF